MSNTLKSRSQLGFLEIADGLPVRQRMRFMPRRQTRKPKSSPAGVPFSLFDDEDRPPPRVSAIAELPTPVNVQLLDEEFPEHERLPRHFNIDFRETTESGRFGTKVFYLGHQIGDFLTDNSHEDDGYRFHDVFHFSFAAVLGWSPMARTLFGCKRRSNRTVDEVEDGARSKILEEAICALIFAYARDREFLHDSKAVECSLLTIIASLTRGREVERRSPSDWEQAILQSCEAWRMMRLHGGGLLAGDLHARTICYLPTEP